MWKLLSNTEVSYELVCITYILTFILLMENISIVNKPKQMSF